MKKLLLVSALCILLIICGCSAATEPENTQLPNPIKEVEGSADFEPIGITLKAPASAEDAVYTIIDDKVASIDYTLDGTEYGLRASYELSGEEIHGMNFDFEDEVLGVDGDGDNYSYSVNVKMVAQGEGGVAIAQINMQDADPLHLTLSTLSDIDNDALLSMISDIIYLTLES